MSDINPNLKRGGSHLAGRPRKVTHEARRFAAMIVDSKGYRRSLMQRAHNGTLPPAVEVMLWHYRYGRPVKKVEIDLQDNRTADLVNLTAEQLADRALMIHDEIRSAQIAAEEADRREAQLAAEQALKTATTPSGVM